MSCTEIYSFDKQSNVEHQVDIQNAYLGCMAIWLFLCKKYLNSDNVFGKTKQIWALVSSSKITKSERIVLITTFDKVVVKKENLQLVIDAFNEFEGQAQTPNTSLKEQAKELEKILANDKVFAVAWNQTSVNESKWQFWQQNEEDEGNWASYNLFKEKDHFYLIDMLNEIKQELNF